MSAYRIRAAALGLAGALALSGCAYNGLYSGVSLGYGDGYYGDGYYGYGYPGSGFSRLGYGYGYSPYWGWNDGFYYPGSGFYVYDSYRRKHRWTDAQRRYWIARREQALSSSTSSQPVVVRENWSDFKRNRGNARSQRVERSVSRSTQGEQTISRPMRVERTATSVERRSSASETRRSEVRAQRSSRSNGRRVGQRRED